MLELFRLGVENFNPRLQEGGDPWPASESLGLQYFNPRLQEGGDQFTISPSAVL